MSPAPYTLLPHRIENDAYQNAADCLDRFVAIEAFDHQASERHRHDRHIAKGDLIFDDPVHGAMKRGTIALSAATLASPKTR